MIDENYEARAQTHLASLKRDMRVSLEDAVVRAAHKVMAEFEAMSDERLMKDWGPGPHECHSLPERGPEQPAQQEPVAWFHLHNCEAYFTTEPSKDMVENYWKPLYTSPPRRKPLTDEMRKQMKERCDSMEMRGAFADGWLSAEAAHGIKENT